MLVIKHRRRRRRRKQRKSLTAGSSGSRSIRSSPAREECRTHPTHFTTADFLRAQDLPESEKGRGKKRGRLEVFGRSVVGTVGSSAFFCLSTTMTWRFEIIYLRSVAPRLSQPLIFLLLWPTFLVWPEDLSSIFF
ncbi:unnamed protein product [Linum tenue]|uniref:Uncharacterized protein n=1 Tax=Linum tenue TaxID=586396 RepID=A0AAV0MZD0_9ROSI|nr:unnamed protein product [Linum tenue]